MLLTRKLYREEQFQGWNQESGLPTWNTMWVESSVIFQGRNSENVIEWSNCDRAYSLSQLGTDVKRHATTDVC